MAMHTLDPLALEAPCLDCKGFLSWGLDSFCSESSSITAAQVPNFTRQSTARTCAVKQLGLWATWRNGAAVFYRSVATSPPPWSKFAEDLQMPLQIWSPPHYSEA